MEPESIRAYRALTEAAGKPLLYANPWWLDATCGTGGWNVLVEYDAGRKPISGIPYHRSRIRGLSAITTPPMTQWVSLISTHEASPGEHPYSLSNLPKTAILDLSIKPDQRINLLDGPCTPALKYSFIIPRGYEIGDIRSNYNEGLRRNLKQAKQHHVIQESDDLEGFLTLCHQTYHDRKLNPPPWLNSILPEVYRRLLEHQCGSLTLAISNSKLIAGILTAWDHHSSYYLAGGKVSDESGTAAHALLLDHAIGAACARGIAFDFEGSMHPGIANFFQSFGSTPVAYWQFKKYHGLGRIWNALKL